MVCAPFADPWEENSGKCYFYLFNATVWEQATRVTALDHAAQDTFGMQVSLDTGAVMGSGDAANFKGRVYHFGGYEFFPIPPPIFEPPPGSYLIPGPFELTAITGLPSEQVYYSFNDTNPTPFDDLLAKNHKLTLPYDGAVLVSLSRFFVFVVFVVCLLIALDPVRIALLRVLCSMLPRALDSRRIRWSSS